MTTHRQLELSPDVRRHCLALTHTFGHVATIRIRNQGNAGRQPRAADSSGSASMLIALGAEVTLTSRSGGRGFRSRTCSSTTPTTTMRSDEVLTAIHVPPLPAGTRSTYISFCRAPGRLRHRLSGGTLPHDGRSLR
jgi:carbon-monoxide dehydrogenase medium subunit